MRQTDIWTGPIDWTAGKPKPDESTITDGSSTVTYSKVINGLDWILLQHHHDDDDHDCKAKGGEESGKEDWQGVCICIKQEPPSRVALSIKWESS